jgi:MEDS: MEthanogen/methylotroph, DcmR Sensory domain
MLDVIEDPLQDGKAGGYGLTRILANMEWALEEMPGVEDLLEYETRLNHILPQQDAVAVCTYDLSKFSASVLVDILRTHPWAVVGKTLQQNPFYIPPDQKLREIRGRA